MPNHEKTNAIPSRVVDFAKNPDRDGTPAIRYRFNRVLQVAAGRKLQHSIIGSATRFTGIARAFHSS
jgi:hypothetical protein